MSKPAPPKSSFTQSLLLFAVIFLGMNLFFNRNNTPTVVGTHAEILVKMRTASSALKPDEVRQLQGAFDKAVNAEESAKKIAKDQAEQLRMEGNLITADAQYQAALKKNDINQVTMAWQSIHNLERSRAHQPIWDTAFTLPKVGDLPERKVSPRQFLADTTKELDSRFQKEPVWGLVNGWKFIDSLVALTGRNPQFSYAFAALVLALIVRAIVWPLAQRQLMWSRKMTALQPIVKDLEAAYKKKDPSGAYRQTPEFQQKMMGLYREYGINPVAGCLPALAQMPLFLFVYQCMLHYRFEFKNGLFLWINPAMSKATNGFIAPSLGEMDYILLVVYGISMIATTYLAPVSDPANARQQRMIGLGFAVLWTVMMFFFLPLPSAFVLYWIFTNVFSSLQSLRAYRLPMPPLEKVQTAGGGAFPFDPAKFGMKTNGQSNGPTQAATNGTPDPTASLFKKPKAQQPKK